MISLSSLFGAENVLQVGGEKQLFVGPWDEDGRDVHLVESMKNVTMRMNEAHVTGEKIPAPGRGFMMHMRWRRLPPLLPEPGCRV